MSSGTSILDAVQASYDAGVTDEFLTPIVNEDAPRLEPGDTAIFFNFRPDRARQLSRKLLDAGYDLTTMTRYAEDLDTPVVLGEQRVAHTIAEVVSAAGKRQLHAAETEKYAHVTYFFNGGVEHEWEGEKRILVPSPRDVPSYDHKPEMSAEGVADAVCDELAGGEYSFCVVNFANPDMVGHTGVIPAVVKAVETTDRCLGKIVDRVTELGGVCLVTADHGNAEEELNPDGSPQTAHTTNLVPLIVTSPERGLREQGEIADLAPTALRLLGLNPPAEMTGKDLLSTD